MASIRAPTESAAPSTPRIPGPIERLMMCEDEVGRSSKGWQLPQEIIAELRMHPHYFPLPVVERRRFHEDR